MTQIWSYGALLVVLELWNVIECSPVKSKSNSRDDSQISPIQNMENGANEKCNTSRNYDISSGTTFSPRLWLKYRTFSENQRRGIEYPEDRTTSMIAFKYLSGGKHYYFFPDEMLTQEEIDAIEPNKFRHFDNCTVDACHFSVIFGNQSAARRQIYSGIYRSPEMKQTPNGEVVIEWPTGENNIDNNSTIAYITVKDKCDGIPRIYDDWVYITKGGVGYKYVKLIIRRDPNTPFDYRVRIFTHMDADYDASVKELLPEVLRYYDLFGP